MNTLTHGHSGCYITFIRIPLQVGPFSNPTIFGSSEFLMVFEE